MRIRITEVMQSPTSPKQNISIAVNLSSNSTALCREPVASEKPGRCTVWFGVAMRVYVKVMVVYISSVCFDSGTSYGTVNDVSVWSLFGRWKFAVVDFYCADPEDKKRCRLHDRKNENPSHLPSVLTICGDYLDGRCANNPCPRYHSAEGLPYQWQWKISGRQGSVSDWWNDFVGNANVDIERSFCDETKNECQVDEVRIGHDIHLRRTYALDFDSMTYRLTTATGGACGDHRWRQRPDPAAGSGSREE